MKSEFKITIESNEPNKIKDMIDDKLNSEFNFTNAVPNPYANQKVIHNLKEQDISKQISSKIDKISWKKKENGKAQSVYLKKEVFDFCNSIAEDYNIGISEVINTLILDIMKKNR